MSHFHCLYCGANFEEDWAKGVQHETSCLKTKEVERHGYLLMASVWERYKLVPFSSSLSLAAVAVFSIGREKLGNFPRLLISGFLALIGTRS